MGHGAFAFTRQCRFQTGNACYPIALVDEVNMIYSTMGIDIWEVIGAAKTKPFGFMPSYPGPGLGGHYIRSIRFISHGRLANTVNIRISSSWPARSIHGCPSTLCTPSRMHSIPATNLASGRGAIEDTRNAMADMPVSRGKVWKRNQGHRGLYGLDRYS